MYEGDPIVRTLCAIANGIPVTSSQELQALLLWTAFFSHRHLDAEHRTGLAFN